MKYIYSFSMFVLFLLMCFYLVATNIVGGYLIGDELYMNHLIFPPAPDGTPTVVDQALYAYKVSGYPYYAVLCFLGMVVLNIFYRKKGKSK
ncbi:hypothetical protein H9655_15505 [Cytobacillus sp. Sa5YUA1]|uniref:Uncharacterized protein n=1 Tax=Cytobacillus stercorigallinarum TaxID=2762240 RepID=A0ABR8QSB9_9BACI|nr:hypothetical protein [Cytobacillus stercorigallinarum]MBD7938441.1 hypothetical protein [Cytobacillus stercorigallinarum]